MALAKERLQESQEVRWTTGHWEPAFRCFRVILFLPFSVHRHVYDASVSDRIATSVTCCAEVIHDSAMIILANWGKVWPPIFYYLIICT